MKNSKDTIPIIFQGGAYGTFVEWCLNYFSGEDVVENPFNLNGNSHRFRGNHLLHIDGWRNYLTANENFKFVRFHPKVKETESIIETIEETLLHAPKVIVLYHDDTLTLLGINNKFDKIWKEGYLKHNEDDLNNHYRNWNKSSREHMDIWEIREFLSMYIFKQHAAEFENNLIEKYENKNIKKINIKNLFFNFENTIKDLLLWSDLALVKDNFREIHDIWTSKQEHKNKDVIAKKIIESILEEKYYDWSNYNLSIIDEAFVQMTLRDLHKLDLRCYNLNVFPTNTKDLKDLLFDV